MARDGNRRVWGALADGTSFYLRSTSLSNTVGGSAMTDRTATRFAWLLWALTVALTMAYIPLAYSWHTAAIAPNTALAPNDIERLKYDLPRVIRDVCLHASYLAFA